MASKLTLNNMQSFASDKGGKCLSKEYNNTTQHLKWMCKRGHTWDSPYYVLQQGGWCPRCVIFETKEEKFIEIKKISEKNDFTCLSDSYLSREIKLKFQCKNGHKFQKSLKDFKDRPLCYTCYKHEEKQEGHNKMLAIAKKRKGKFLSIEFKGTDKKHKWQCNKGHTWMALPSNIEQGRWCPFCSKITNDLNQRKKAFLELQKYVSARGGKIITKKYSNQNTPINFQCKKGHTWYRHPVNVYLKQTWCPVCKIKEEEQLVIKKLQSIAQKRKGKLLSDEYYQSRKSLEWQCEKGHIWQSTADNIKRGAWCQMCKKEASKDKLKLSIAEAEKYVEGKGGKLLSKKYENSKIPLKWQCSKGHTWLVPLQSIKAGYWCQQCSFDAKRSSITEFQKIAKERGGKLLSQKYVGSNSKLKWQCDKGHVWMTTPSHIKVGSWCPTCGLKIAANNKKRHTIPELQKHAKNLGGKFISENYINILKPVKWECKEGHIWPASIYSIIGKGSWCKICSYNNRRKPIFEGLKVMAKQKKGFLISEKYVNNSTHLEWQCNKGHIWNATSKSIKKGSWCPICRKINKYRLENDH